MADYYFDTLDSALCAFERSLHPFRQEAFGQTGTAAPPGGRNKATQKAFYMIESM